MLLEPMVARLRSRPDISSILVTACRDVVALHGAEFGNVQLLGEDGALWLVHCEGLCDAFVQAMARVEVGAATVCARAFRTRKTIHVPDIADDPSFKPFLKLAAETGFRAVLSSPLVSTAGEAIGVVSSHFANPKVATPIELTTREAYCRELADALVAMSSAPGLAAAAPRLTAALLRDMNQEMAAD